MYKQHPTCLSHSFSIPNWRFRKWTAAIHQWNERKCDNFHSILHLMCDLFIYYLFVRNTLWTDTTTHSISNNRNEKKLENCNFLFFDCFRVHFGRERNQKKKVCSHLPYRKQEPNMSHSECWETVSNFFISVLCQPRKRLCDKLATRLECLRPRLSHKRFCWQFNNSLLNFVRA